MASTSGLPTSTTHQQSPLTQLRTLIRRILRSATFSQGVCAIMDQAVTSGGRFVSTILVGRACGADGLGLYSLGMSVAMIALAIQHSLITAPYTVYLHRRSEKSSQQRYAGSMLVAWVVLACVIGLVGVSASNFLSMQQSQGAMSTLLRVLALGIPILLLRELVRQLTFAKLRFKAALLVDSLAASLQIAFLLTLSYLEQLTPYSAWLAIASAYAFTCGIWFYLSREMFQIRKGDFVPDVSQNWRVGRWDLASNVLMNCQLYLMHWCLAIWIGVEATGVYAACATVLLFANPIIMGLGNYLMPRVSRTLSTEGVDAMAQVVRKATMILGGTMIVFSIFAVTLGGFALELFFQIEPTAAHRIVIALLAASATAGSIGVGPEWALLAIQKPRTTFFSVCTGLSTTILAAIIFVKPFGVIGAALGLFLGNMLSASYIWLAYRVVIRHQLRQAN